MKMRRLAGDFEGFSVAQCRGGTHAVGALNGFDRGAVTTGQSIEGIALLDGDGRGLGHRLFRWRFLGDRFLRRGRRLLVSALLAAASRGSDFRWRPVAGISCAEEWRWRIVHRHVHHFAGTAAAAAAFNPVFAVIAILIERIFCLGHAVVRSIAATATASGGTGTTVREEKRCENEKEMRR